MEVKLSDKTTVEIEALSGYESITADRYIAGDVENPILVTKIYAFCSVRKKNGVETRPMANRAEFDNLAKDLTTQETGALVAAFLRIAEPTEDQLKN